MEIFMSSSLYKFTIQGPSVSRIEEFDDGIWKVEHIGTNEVWSYDGNTGSVTKIESEHGYSKVRTYTDADGDGIYNKISSSSSSLPGSGSIKLIDDSYNDDILYGYDSADHINSGDGDDYIKSNYGNDILNGGNGNDFLYAGAGDDEVDGGAGDDLIFGSDGAGNDIYRGGIGIDTIEYSNLVSSITVNLSRAVATGEAINTDRLYDIENIISGDADDTITGSAKANHLYGGLGDDSLNGGLGVDELTGGDGHDAFIFNTKLSLNNADIILDFEEGIDTIQLDDAVFKNLKNDVDLSDNLVIGTRALDINDYLIYNQTTNVLYYDSDGSGRGAQVAVAVVTIGSIDASDFVVI